MVRIERKLFFFSFLFLSIPLFLLAENPERIAHVEVSGNNSVESAAILFQVKTKEGEVYSLKVIREDLARIYKMGYFERVDADAQKTTRGVIVTFLVKERVRIREVTFKGNKEVKTKDLKDALDLKEHQILDESKLAPARKKMTSLYEQKGYYLAEVDYEIVPVKDKAAESDLVVHIKEGEKVKIKHVEFIGNKVFSDSDLRSLMQTTEYNPISAIFGRGYYQKSVFDRDIQILTFHYYKNGFVQVEIGKPQVYISSDKKWIYIYLVLTEGEQFRVGKLDFAGDLLWEKEELKKDLQLKEGEIFNSEHLSKDILDLTNKYKDQGYAFANVVPETPLYPEEKRIDVTFNFEKGPKVYFGRIDVEGNVKTRDKVIRRELLIREGELYSETKLQKSIENIRRLGFFSEVTHIRPQGEKPDELNLVIQVKERSTGSLQVGAGFSTVDKFVVRVDLQQSNLFGKGQALSFSGFFSGSARNFSSSYTEPRLLDTKWSLGFDAYDRLRETIDFSEKKLGGGVSVGHPIIWDEFQLLTGYRWEDVNLKFDPANINIFDPKDNEGITSSVFWTFSWDNRDDRFAARSGMYHSLYNEFAGLGGDRRFLKEVLTTQWYFPLIWGSVLRLRGVGGAVFQTTPTKIPSTEKFILGGPATLRGFRPFGIGPTLTNTAGKEVVVGGTRELLANVEIELPLIPSVGIRGVFFYDTGDAFDHELDIRRFRSDVGFGFRWRSPIGPISVEWGFPVHKRKDEKSPVFNFSFVPPF